jgi:hypothetical protein
MGGKIMNADAYELLDESGRWRAREVTYARGRWDTLKPLVPVFTTEPFRSAADAPANPRSRDTAPAVSRIRRRSAVRGRAGYAVACSPPLLGAQSAAGAVTPQSGVTSRTTNH